MPRRHFLDPRQSADRRYTVRVRTTLLVLGLLACRDDDPGPAPARRLTATEYNNTVRDLLGFDLDDTWPQLPDAEEPTGFWGSVPTWPWDFPAEPTQFGFEGMVEVQVPSTILVEQLSDAALHFGGYADIAPALWTCGRADRDDACAWESVARFANRAYRRPLDEDETARLRAGFRTLVDEAGIEDGVRLTVAAVLMSPQALYRLEYEDQGRGTIVELSQWELASRMSYFLWESMPDAALFEAAASGDLNKDKDLEAQARRMLRDPRAEAMLVRFHEQWLDLDTLYGARPDMYTYAAGYTPGLLESSPEDKYIFAEDEWSGAMVGTRKAMRAEAALFLAAELREVGTLRGLLTSTRGYASWIEADGTRVPFSTATLYNSPAEPEGEPVHTDAFYDGKMNFTLATHTATLPGDERAGVLTLGAVLAGRAHPVHPAPIQRGVFVLERMACETIGAPPSDTASLLPADDASLEGTNRQRTEAITAAVECAACHNQINPVGFAFENYDSLGGHRTEDNAQPVDAAGSFALSGGEVLSFESAVSLAEGLAGSEQVHRCYAQHWLRYALGREVTEAEPGVEEMKASFYEDGGHVEELLVQLVMSDLFRTRRAANP